MTKSTVAKTTREGTNMSKALAIFNTLIGTIDHSQSLRQRCIAAFKDDLGQAEVTAATYYNLCVQRNEVQLEDQDAKVLASKRKYKFSAVRMENASSDVAKKVHLFLSKKAAQDYATLFNYGAVVPGVITPGQTVAL